MVTNQSFGKRVRETQACKAANPERARGRTGRFDGPFVSRLEGGHVEPCLQTLAVLSRALDVTLAEFFKELG